MDPKLNPTATDRLKLALNDLGPAVLKGGFTTLLGVMLLSQASSSIFRIFFKSLFLTVTFGVFHGVVALPVFMTIHIQVKEYICGNTGFEERVEKLEEDDEMVVGEL